MENRLLRNEEKIIQIIPVSRRLDAVIIDDFEESMITRVPVLYLQLIEVTAYFSFGEPDTYNEVRMGDIDPYSDINGEGGFEKWDGYLGLEYDGIQKDWSKKINDYKNKK